MWDIFPHIIESSKPMSTTVHRCHVSIAAHRALLTAAIATVLAGCGGGTQQDTPPPAASASLKTAQAGDLVAYAKERLRARFGMALPAGLAATTGGATASSDTIAAATPPGTLVQEAGVDEADLLKIDGNTVLSLHGSILRRHQLAARQLNTVDAVTLESPPENAYVTQRGLHLVPGGPAMVIEERWQVGQWSGQCPAEACAMIGLTVFLPTQPSVHLQRVARDSGLTAAPAWTLDGRLVGSRRIGNQLLLVTTHVPALAVDALPATATTAEREAVLASLTAQDLLPRRRQGNAQAIPLVQETECLLQPGNASTAVEITTVTVLDLSTDTWRSRCFVGGTEAMYMTADALVLATTRWPYLQADALTVYPAQMQTDVHQFALTASAVDYRASGSVPGHLGWDTSRKSQRFSAWRGDLRVLSFTGDVGWGAAPVNGTAPSPATLTVLRESGGQLQPVGQLPNTARSAPIGKPDEQVYAVRFVGDRGYVVTFRQIDPLYVLDLSNAADPLIAGSLETPGFSQDLYDLGPGWLLGTGRETDAQGRVTGLGISLFDVRDAQAPRLAAGARLGDGSSATALDASPQGINLWRSGTRAQAALPVAVELGGLYGTALQRVTVDTGAGSLALSPLLPASTEGPSQGVAVERALVLGDQVLYLDGTGALTLHDW